MEVQYNGMGFMLIKKGVFEKVEYPWFSSNEEASRRSGRVLF